MKKIIFVLTLAVMLACVFALSIGAEYNKSEAVSVKMADGSIKSCALYDADGDALVWYTLDNGATLLSVKTKDLLTYTEVNKQKVFSGLVESKKLSHIYLDEETPLQIHNDNTTNKIVVANLRECTFEILDHSSYKATFSDSKVVQYVYLPNTLTNMGCNVFQNCTNLKVCDIPSDASFIISSANNFIGCTSLEEINLYGCTAVKGSIIHSHFADCTSLKKVVINPATIDWVSMGAATFRNCPLTQFGLIEGECTIPANTTSIGNECFKKSSFDRVVMSDSVATLGYNVFASNSTLSYVYISSGLTSSGIRVFLDCTKLSSVEGLENCGLTEIPYETFRNTGFTSIVIPSNIVSLGENSFYASAGLTNVTLPAGMTLVGTRAFSNCPALTTVTFLGNAGENAVIGEAAFENCSKLNSIHIPEGFTTINNCAFKKSGLTEVSLPTTLTTINGREQFLGTKLTKVEGLENTKIAAIPNSMFHGIKTWCPDVVQLPNTLTTIGTYALADVGMKTLILGANVTAIDSEAFVNCPNLKTVYLPSTLTNIKANAFNNNKTNNICFFVTSSDNEYLATVQAGVKGASTATVITLDAYNQATGDEYANGRFVISGYNLCDAFYKGSHTMAGEEKINVTSYFEVITIGDRCTREGCGEAIITDTIDAIFVSYGYSMTEVEIGGKLSMSQFFGIDKTNLEKYTTLTGNAFEYGFVVSSNADPMNEANSGLIAEGKTYITTQNGFKHDYFAVAVAGFTDATVDNALTFCVYVKDGEKVSYLDNGETVETVNMKSYNQIKALLGK